MQNILEIHPANGKRPTRYKCNLQLPCKLQTLWMPTVKYNSSLKDLIFVMSNINKNYHSQSERIKLAIELVANDEDDKFDVAENVPLMQDIGAVINQFEKGGYKVDIGIDGEELSNDYLAILTPLDIETIYQLNNSSFKKMFTLSSNFSDATNIYDNSQLDGMIISDSGAEAFLFCKNTRMWLDRSTAMECQLTMKETVPYDILQQMYNCINIDAGVPVWRTQLASGKTTFKFLDIIDLNQLVDEILLSKYVTFDNNVESIDINFV